MSETQFGRDLCATGRHDFEDGPACVRCGEAQVSAPMPERVKRYDLVQKGTWDTYGAMERDDKCGEWVDFDDYRDTVHDLALTESRLLAAEARVREVEEWLMARNTALIAMEAERDAIAENCSRASSGWIAATADYERLRAERDALVELVRDVARSGVAFEDKRLDYVEIQIDTDTWAQARAILAREER